MEEQKVFVCDAPLTETADFRSWERPPNLEMIFMGISFSIWCLLQEDGRLCGFQKADLGCYVFHDSHLHLAAEAQGIKSYVIETQTGDMFGVNS